MCVGTPADIRASPSPEPVHPVAGLVLAPSTGNDPLLHWTAPRLLWTLLTQILSCELPCLSLLNQFSQKTPPSISDHPAYLSRFLIPRHPQMMSHYPGLPLARILLGLFSQNFPLLLRVIFHPLTPILLLGYKFPLFLFIVRVESNLPLLLKSPIIIVPLNKVFLTIL